MVILAFKLFLQFELSSLSLLIVIILWLIVIILWLKHIVTEKFFFLFVVRGFETEQQFEKFVKTDPESAKILAAVVFEHSFTHDDEPLPLQVKATLLPAKPV